MALICSRVRAVGAKACLPGGTANTGTQGKVVLGKEVFARVLSHTGKGLYCRTHAAALQSHPSTCEYTSTPNHSSISKDISEKRLRVPTASQQYRR